MVNLQIRLPDGLNDYLQSQIAAGRYASQSEFVADLIVADQFEREIAGQLNNNAHLADLLHESLDGDPGGVWGPEMLREIKRRAAEPSRQSPENP